jgi:hypothetical protein
VVLGVVLKVLDVYCWQAGQKKLQFLIKSVIFEERWLKGLGLASEYLFIEY